MAGPSGDPEAHKFAITYHPNSGRAPEIQEGLDGGNKKPSPPRNLEPWSPYFKSREDFEIAEVIMRVGVRKADCNRIFKAVKRCLSGKGSFNLNTFSDVQGAWERASSQLTTVSPQLSDVSLLNGSRFSLMSTKFQFLTKVKIRSSRYTIVHCGNGRSTSSRTSAWLHILNGMRGRFISLMKGGSLAFIPSHGPQTHFGNFKYASHFCYVLCKLYLLFRKIDIVSNPRVCPSVVFHPLCG